MTARSSSAYVRREEAPVLLRPRQTRLANKNEEDRAETRLRHPVSVCLRTMFAGTAQRRVTTGVTTARSERSIALCATSGMPPDRACLTGEQANDYLGHLVGRRGRRQ